MPIKQKKCPYCQVFYIPYRENQKTCGKKRCRKAKKAENQERWCKKNPNYFKGLYFTKADWREKHPRYPEEYKEKNPDYVERNRIKQKLRRKRKMR